MMSLHRLRQIITVADSLGWSARDHCFVAKRSFFYTMGLTGTTLAEKLSEELAAAGLTMHIISAREHRHNWPTTSYWAVRFTVTSPPVTGDRLI